MTRMRRFSQEWNQDHLRMMFANVRRRRAWFVENASPRQFTNAMLAFGQFALKNEVVRAWPVVMKVDISPLCNLHCTFCVHARPSRVEPTRETGTTDLLAIQSFKRTQMMSVERFRQIVNEVDGKSMAVALYYLGDPLVHPHLDEMCKLAASARLNSHVSTNFSFGLTDERIASLVTSGLTHLTVCIDGMSQESYARTRVGGRLDLVLANLRRVLEVRRRLKRRYPRVEVQFIKFQHNVAELEEAVAWSGRNGVDQFTHYWGQLHNYADFSPRHLQAFAPKPARRLPGCTWPYFAMQIKYNGDVIPCCYYREAEQYATDESESRIVGNVFQTSVWEVWNSPQYQALRRIVADPQRIDREPPLRETFCNGCPTIFDTDASALSRGAAKHRWEDHYIQDDRGRVFRKST
jgi:MoaA/NifB/PqqE/SkfB family radical SAM enzyme